MRFAVDTGGTFTDLIVEDDDNGLHMFKASTTPDDPIRGVLDSLQVAADGFGMDLGELLGKGELFGLPLFGESYQSWVIMILPAGGFFTLAGWLLLFNWRAQVRARRAAQLEEANA